jgi:hypothetical protein
LFDTDFPHEFKDLIEEKDEKGDINENSKSVAIILDGAE